jgi:2-polyprenyl-6-methoxyphenol hydroxylase-like FAD-dependent oxidoreductase
MTAAMELARQGIPVRLIESTAEPKTTSRAVGVQARTLELFEQRGNRRDSIGCGLQSKYPGQSDLCRPLPLP